MGRRARERRAARPAAAAVLVRVVLERAAAERLLHLKCRAMCGGGRRAHREQARAATSAALSGARLPSYLARLSRPFERYMKVPRW